MEKRRNCSWGAISPLFHNIFNIYFYLKESNYLVICKNWLFKLFYPQYYKSDMSVRISRTVFEGPFDFEITRVDCIYILNVLLHVQRFRLFLYCYAWDVVSFDTNSARKICVDGNGLPFMFQRFCLLS